MASRIDPTPEGARFSARHVVLVGLFTAGALLAGLLESRFPLPFPGMRLGLSNVFYLLALLLFGASEALCVAALRTLLLFVLTGNAFALACSAGGLACSLPLAIFLYKTFGHTLSVPAISVASSAAFNFGQLGAVVLMTGEPSLFVYFPILMLAGFFTGYAVGALADNLWRRLRRFA